EGQNVGMFERKFHKALADDFNTPEALAAVFELINRAQPHLWELPRADAARIKSAITNALRTLGLAFTLPKIPQKITLLAQKREESRRNKQFVQADALRKEMFELGYLVEDTPMGPFVWPVYSS
ncbi:MAG: DALR domain-containing protein, partial [Patescibacteria group bacterium]